MRINSKEIRWNLDGRRILPTALLDVYKSKTKPTIELEQSNDILQATDEDEQRTIASDITEQSEVNELVDEQPVLPTAMETPKKILNRFNFCEQGIQTYILSKKVRDLSLFHSNELFLVEDVTTLTDAIPRKKFVGLANQRIIYQEYLIDYRKQVRDVFTEEFETKISLAKE